MSTWALIRDALARPETLAGGDPARTARLIGVGAAGAALFGAMIGSRNPGLQPLYSAIKLPAVLLLPMMLTLPTFHRLMAATDTPMTWPELTRHAAIAVARIGLILTITTPIMWVAWVINPGHADAVQLVAALVALAFWGGVRPAFQLTTTALTPLRWAGVALLAVTLGQTAWMLRPFVGARGEPAHFLEDGTGFFLNGLVNPTYLRRAPTHRLDSL